MKNCFICFFAVLSCILFSTGKIWGQKKAPVVSPVFGKNITNDFLIKNKNQTIQSITSTGNVFIDGGERLVSMQNNDGGWGWPLTGTSAFNTVGPIAMGLAQAYQQTGNSSYRSALVNAGNYLLTKSNNFSPSDGYLAAQLDKIFGGSTYKDFVLANFYNKLAAGTYNRNGAGTLYTTSSYILLIRNSRTGTSANMAAWDLGMGLVGASMCGASTSEWIAGVEAEINELNPGTTDAGNYYDVLGLAGALYGLAYVHVEFDPTAGAHASANNLNDLANILASYQINNGGFAWNANWVKQNDGDEAVQETAYAILALNEVNRSAFLTKIIGAADYLKSIQLPTGGFEDYVGYGEYNEVTGEALWGISIAFPPPVYNTSKDVFYPTIQEAITDANFGDVLSIAAGTYNENLTITQSLILQSSGSNPKISSNKNNSNHRSIQGAGATTINGSITIAHDGVTIDGFTITNPTGNVGIYANAVNNITIQNNHLVYIGSDHSVTSGSAQAINIHGSTLTSISTFNIKNNEISFIGNLSLEHTAGLDGSAKGIYIGDGSTTGDINNITIENNSISYVYASMNPYAYGGAGAYGILVNHVSPNLRIINNTIIQVGGLWAHGIGLEGNTPNAVVQGNNISYLGDAKWPSDAAAVNVEDNTSANTLNIHLNNFSNIRDKYNGSGFGVKNVTGIASVNAEYNWWNSSTGPNHSSNPGGTGVKASDNVDFTPWLTNPWTGTGYPETIISWPTNNAKVYTSTPDLHWYLSFSASPTSYDVLIRKSTNPGYSGSSPDYFSITGLNSNTTTVPSNSLVPGEQYYYKVITHYNSNMSSTGDFQTESGEESFTVDYTQGGGAVVPIPSWPIENATVYSSSPTLNWYLTQGSSGLTYQIQYSNTVDGNGALNGTITQLPASSPFTSNLYYQLNSLTPEAPYYWQVRSTSDNGGNWSNWSTVASFNVYNQVSGAVIVPVPSWPVGGNTVYSDSPVLNWYLNGGGENLQYQVQYSTDNTQVNGILTNGLNIQPLTANLYVQLSSLTPGAIYYWQVRSTNDNGAATWSNWSNVESFKIIGGGGGQALPTPVASWPTGSNTVYTDKPTFSWYLNQAPAGGCTYTLEIKNQLNDFDGTGANTTNSILITGITGNTYTLGTGSEPSLTSGATYHWRVKMVSGAISSLWSENNNLTAGAKFSVAAISSSIVAPTIGAPVNVAIPTSTPSFSWYLTTKPPVSQTYRLELSKNPDMSNTIMQFDNIGSFTKEVNSLSTGTYFWRVQSSVDGKYSDYSKTASFVITKVTGIENKYNNVPKTFSLAQNYPNPFNPSTMIKYELPMSSFVTLKIYNMLGQEVKTLVNEQRESGSYTVDWKGDNNKGQQLASGAYIYRITAGSFVRTMKMVLLK
ncbi:MAG: T9SS type A sorting domain-containing protein [Bacteroidetes bacterium]|nr:T9SS type A sorting domain-containing protein [Bacteroidota bacterium]